MERDFMGLAVKQEISDEPIDAAPLRSSQMQWSFSNKSPFQGAQDHKSYSGFMQKDIVSEKQSGVGYTMTTYPTHHRFINRTANPVPAIPSRSPVVGTTDLRSASKSSVAPAQLTIFYNGSVSVYDNISSEKAQAIMLLAGNGHPPLNSIPTVTAAAAPVQASMPRSSILDGFVVSQSQPYSTTPFRSSPTAITTLVSGSRFSGWPSTIIDMNANKQGGNILVPSNRVDQPQKVVNATATVPQFRRKSLARFLEKRKERVVNTSPYADSTS
ncbi:hypothetical protein ACP275_04G184000 [Erythranthe tilingii]